MAKRVNKADLPSKICPVCGRPFVWRRKWAKDWPAVRYCSERCRRAGGPVCQSGAGSRDP